MFKAIITIQILIVVAVLGTAIVYGPGIVTGIVDRVDFMIGYSGK